MQYTHGENLKSYWKIKTGSGRYVHKTDILIVKSIELLFIEINGRTERNGKILSEMWKTSCR
jgi:hypothetical protein